MGAETRQMLVIASAQADGSDPRVRAGARCALIAVLDPDRLAEIGWLDHYGDGDGGLDVGWLLHDSLEPHGWTDVRIDDVTPMAGLIDAEALTASIRTAADWAAREGVAHVVLAAGGGRLN